MKIDHDQVFKRLLELFFREFMELFYPTEAALIDFRRFEFLRDEIFTDLMAKMEYNRREQVRLKADFQRLMLSCPVDPARRSVLFEFIETYMPLTSAQQSEFKQLLTTSTEYEEIEKMITSYELAGIEKGKVKGKAAGKAEGKAVGRMEGQKRSLLLLLEKRFGSVSKARRKAIDKINSPA